jgi:hypothetical protein
MWDRLSNISRYLSSNRSRDFNEVNAVTKESRSKKIGLDAEYTHALLSHRSPAVIIKTLENTVNDYHNVSKTDQELLKINLEQLSPNCIACMAVSNRKQALRRTARIKHTEQNVNALIVQSQHNETAHRVKQESAKMRSCLLNIQRDLLVLPRMEN